MDSIPSSMTEKASFDILCPKHKTQPITQLQITDKDHVHALCSKCLEDHQTKPKDDYHHKSIISMKDLRDRKIFQQLSKVAEKEGANSPEEVFRGLELEFARLRERIDKIFDETKSYVLSCLYRNFPRKKGWAAMSDELNKSYEKILTNKIKPDAEEFKIFAKSYNNVLKLLENKDKDQNIRVYWYKDMFTKLGNLASDTFI